MPANLISCRPASYGEFASDAYRHLPKIGIHNVEIAVPAADQWTELAGELKKNELNVSSVAGGIDLSKNDEVANFEQVARGAQRLGAKIIFLSVKSGGVPLQQCYGKLRGMGDVAKNFGATIALETHPDLVTNGETAVATMKGTDHPNVRLNYDSANLYYYNEGVDGIAELKKFLPYLGAVHLKETNGRYKTWYFPGLHEGDGNVDFPAIFALCNQAGFFGPFTIEIEGIEGETLSREQACARIENSVKYLKSIGAM